MTARRSKRLPASPAAMPQDMRNRVLFGDCRQILREMATQGVKVQMCVTSPPYFGLRAYGGGDAEIGQEASPAAYIAAMVDVFRAVRDVLADDGVLFLNIGDSYAGSWGNYGGQNRGKGNSQRQINVGSSTISGAYIGKEKWRPPTSRKMAGIREKELIGIPWMLAFALRADGWMLRQELIWNKPNPTPESVADRCTKSHEHIFLLTKSPNYYFDSRAIREAASTQQGSAPALRNKRTVWTVNTRAHRGAHFATFPPELIVPCVLAGSRPAGKRCGCEELLRAPGRSVTRREQRHHAREMLASTHRAEIESLCGKAFRYYSRIKGSTAQPLPDALRVQFLINGWITPAPPCDCPTFAADVVLDPFMGSGTSAAVAIELGRDYLGCELNTAYKPLQDARIAAARPASFSSCPDTPQIDLFPELV